ncbi:hypothetical protein [Ehrlichia ruminantium]|nr:hypothetical protein [Ehrlichia ruminantium]
MSDFNYIYTLIDINTTDFNIIRRLIIIHWSEHNVDLGLVLSAENTFTF